MIADHFYCISLESESDRREKLYNEFLRVGLNDVEFVIVQKDKEDTKRGCFNSHQMVAKMGLDKGYNRICIFEDDVIFIKNIEKLHSMLIEISNWYKSNNIDKLTDLKFNILFIGHLPVRPLIKTNHNLIYHTQDSRYLHAYILSQNGMHIMSELEYQGRHIDYDIRNIKYKYALYPMIAYQDDCPTTNNYSNSYLRIMKFRNIITCKSLCIKFEKIMKIIGNIITLYPKRLYMS